MRIRAGYEIAYECWQATPMILALNIHPSRRGDLLTDQTLRFSAEAGARRSSASRRARSSIISNGLVR